MTIVDIIIAAVIALSLVFGALRGLVKEALSLSFWVVAAVLASVFSAQAGQQLWSWALATEPLQRIAGFATIFIVTVFVGGILSNLVSALMNKAGLGGADRALGALFGIIRGIVLVLLVVVFTAELEFTRSWYEQSLLVPYLQATAAYFLELLGLAPDAVVAA